MAKETTNKKTLWGRFKSWLAGTWLGRAWSKVWNTVKGWFSSNGATKASDGQPEAKTKDNGKDNGPKVSQDKSEVASPAASVAEEPAKPTPVTVPQPGHAGPDNGDKSFDMKETNQNPVQSDSTPLTQPRVPEVEKFSGKITVYSDGKNEVELKLNVGKHFDTLTKWKNPATPKQFCVFIKLSGKILYITGRYSSRTGVGGNVVAINSVGIDGTGTVCNVNDLKGMKDLLGLNETTAEVKAEIYKEAKAAETEAKTPAPDVNGGNSSSKAVKSSKEQPDEGQEHGSVASENPAPKAALADSSSEEEVYEYSGEFQELLKKNSKVESHEPAAIGETQAPLKEVVDTPEKQSEGEDKGQEHRLETPEDQDNGQQAKEDAASVGDDEKRDPEAANPSNAPPAPIGGESAEGSQEHVDEVSGSQGEDQREAWQEVESNSEPAANGGAPFSQTTCPKPEHVPTTNGKPRT
ncbi:hypothetical protein [Wolbachia endosymbiont (group E) of Neria commutata]|uniref:hypothetical protein n=1 Tax=Wolbachia endosymbiont (group E) of Neria commutata TaxID=3066149 RepID=UPI0031332D5E